MNEDEIAQNAKEKFLNQSALFLKEFEPVYIEFFASLCVSYDNTISKDEAREIALSIYQNLFKCNFTIQGLREDLLIKMRHDGVMIGFLINRSMFYLIENYIKFAKQKKISPQVELLISCVSRFINVLESEVSDKYNASLGEFDFQGGEISFASNSIIETFQKMKDEGQKIQFLNLYQGVPIICDADIVSIDGENVSFHTEHLQEIAMKLDGRAFIIKNDYFSKHLKADIVYNNFMTNTVVLHNFIYLLNMPALQREFVRVHPDIVAKVYLHQFGNVETTGRLYDLSLSGLGVLSAENNGVFVGARVLVAFDLNSSKTETPDKIEVEAEVMNIIEVKGAYRYCMRIFPEKEMNDKIITYIAQREKEIIQNLEDELKEYIV